LGRRCGAGAFAPLAVDERRQAAVVAAGLADAREKIDVT
jgi:hypothetical protein